MSENITLFGLGRIGLPLALVFCKAGFNVNGVDISPSRIKRIKDRDKFVEPKVDEYLEKYGDRLHVSTTIEETPSVAFIAINTPLIEGGFFFNTVAVERCLREIHRHDEYTTIIIGSTLNPKDSDRFRKVHEKICCNPEWVARGSVIDNFENPRFTMLGYYDESVGEIAKTIWRRVHNKPIITGLPIEMEIAKLMLNINHVLGIAFANIVGEICEVFDVKPHKVTNLIAQNLREYKSGLGTMGPCNPKDLVLLKTVGEISGMKGAVLLSEFLKNVDDHVVDRQIEKITSYGKKKIGVFGTSYKPNVPYIDASQPIEIIIRLLSKGYKIFIYDPLAEENTKKILGERVNYCVTKEECLNKSEVVFVGTNNFSNIKTNKIVVDPWR